MTHMQYIRIFFLNRSETDSISTFDNNPTYLNRITCLLFIYFTYKISTLLQENKTKLPTLIVDACWKRNQKQAQPKILF